MKKLPTLEQFLNEAKEEKKTYEYGCSMLYFDFPQMAVIHDNIDEQDIFEDEEDPSFGLEKEPHVTLLYGLHCDECDDDDVIKRSKFESKNPLVLKNISVFKNEKFDVLKFDVDHEDLHKINKSLAELPHTNSYPDYHPHATIAYLKPGTSEKYLQAYEGRSFDVHPKHIVYSKPDGSKLKVSPR